MGTKDSSNGDFWKTQGDFPPTVIYMMWVTMDVHLLSLFGVFPMLSMSIVNVDHLIKLPNGFGNPIWI